MVDVVDELSAIGIRGCEVKIMYTLTSKPMPVKTTNPFHNWSRPSSIASSSSASAYVWCRRRLQRGYFTANSDFNKRRRLW